jgi:hypothetical protein
MPALVDQPNVLKAEFLFHVGGDLDVSTRLYFKYSGTAPTDAVCTTIAGAMHAAWDNAWLGHLSNESSIEGVQITDLTSPVSGFGEELSHVLGTASGPPVAGGTALLQNFNIARRYRGGKPRAYWPILIAADLLTPQEWDPSVLATATSEWATSFNGVIIGSSYSGTTIVEQVNVSYYEGFTLVTNPITGRGRNVNKPRTVAIAPDAITGFVLNGKPASQRRRNLHSS